MPRRKPKPPRTRFYALLDGSRIMSPFEAVDIEAATAEVMGVVPAEYRSRVTVREWKE